MRDKEWIAYILKNGSLPEARLTLLPILKTCDDWKKVLPLGLVDYRTLLAAYEGALVELDGKLYIFAQNTDLGKDADKLKQGQDITPRGGKASLKVSGLKAGTTIEVIDENRTLTAQNGTSDDEFAPLAEHIYMITMGD